MIIRITTIRTDYEPQDAAADPENGYDPQNGYGPEYGYGPEAPVKKKKKEKDWIFI